MALPAVSRLASWIADWAQRRSALRDIKKQRAAEKDWVYREVEHRLGEAHSALQRNDSARASEIWSQVSIQRPDAVLSSRLALRVLLGLRRYEEAESLMKLGQRLRPRDTYFRLGLVQVAQAAGRHDAVVELCASLRRKLPNFQEGYLLASESLLAQDRPDKAESIAAQAMRLFPDEVRGFLSHARAAAERKDWSEALRRWTVVIDRFDHLIGYLGASQAMTNLGDLEQAEALLAAARTRYPTDPGPRAGLARVASAMGRNDIAIDRWRELATRFPLDMRACLEAAAGLDEAGDLAGATRVLAETSEHFPTEQRPRVELGTLFHRHGDFSSAAEVWAQMRRAFPDVRIAYDRGAEALHRLGFEREESTLRAETASRFGAEKAE